MDHGTARMLEERFWLEGASIYDALLDPDCLKAFPSTGAMRAADILNSLKGAPRWPSVTMTDRAVGRAGEDVLVLGYTAEGRRDGSPRYRCFCTSTYRSDNSTGRIVQHQLTLAG